uniref:Uncharacterized protein n=1 Tax=uncultured marine virus TaxID=186617 RepID=A0A0F7L959_9VIRU|nr:hypothetical protein [uncultured marine virus]
MRYKLRSGEGWSAASWQSRPTSGCSHSRLECRPPHRQQSMSHYPHRLHLPPTPCSQSSA